VFRHKFDLSSLAAAILFLTIAARYLVEGFAGHSMSFAWAMPAVLTSIVLIVLLRLVFRSRRRDP
jgi:hypothetical protein